MFSHHGEVAPEAADSSKTMIASPIMAFRNMLRDRNEFFKDEKFTQGEFVYVPTAEHEIKEEVVTDEETSHNEAYGPCSSHESSFYEHEERSYDIQPAFHRTDATPEKILKSYLPRRFENSAEKARKRLAEVLDADIKINLHNPVMEPRAGASSVKSRRDELIEQYGIDKKTKGSRADSSLLLLTKKFLDILFANVHVNLNEAAAKLGVAKRRLYDITNVMESIGFLHKDSKNSVTLIEHAYSAEMYARPVPEQCSLYESNTLLSEPIIKKFRESPQASSSSQQQQQQQRQKPLSDAELERYRMLKRRNEQFRDGKRVLSNSMDLLLESPVDVTLLYFENTELIKLRPDKTIFVVAPPVGGNVSANVQQSTNGSSTISFREANGDEIAVSLISNTAFVNGEKIDNVSNISQGDNTPIGVNAAHQLPSDAPQNALSQSSGVFEEVFERPTSDPVLTSVALGYKSTCKDEIVLPVVDGSSSSSAVPIITPSKMLSVPLPELEFISPMRVLFEPNIHLTPRYHLPSISQGNYASFDDPIPHDSPSLNDIYENSVWKFPP